MLAMTSHSIETASALLSALPFGRSALRAGSALVEEGLACARDWDPVPCQALSHDGVRTVPMLLLWTVLVVGGILTSCGFIGNDILQFT